ncbi:hypothetical protein DFH08DRAFT_847491, partial [Mycena albidolilacea]
ATRDCDWARVTGTGTRQQKRGKDGFLFNSCYLHGTCRGRRRCVGRTRGSMPMSMSKRRGTSEDPGVTGDDWTRRRRAAVPSLYSGAPGSWSTWRQQAKSEGARREDAHRTANRSVHPPCVDVDTQLNSIICYNRGTKGRKKNQDDKASIEGIEGQKI